NTPKKLAAYEELATIYKESGEIRDSVETLETGLEAVDDKEPALKQLVRATYEAQEFQKVVKYYEQLMASSGKPSAFELERLGKVYSQLGQIDKARETWNRIVEIEPDSSKAFSTLAKVLEEEGFQEEALQAKAKAVELEPTDFKLRFDYSQDLASVEQVGEAMEQLQLILDIGEREEAKKEEEEKEKEVKRLRRGQVNWQQVYSMRAGYSGYNRYGRGNWQGSFKDFRPQVIGLLASMAEKSDTLDDLIKSFKGRLEQNPSNRAVKEDLLTIYRSTNRTDEALEIAKAMVEESSNDVDLLQEIAGLYSQQQKVDEAIALVERIIELQPDQKKQHGFSLINLLVQSSQKEKAVEVAKELSQEYSDDMMVQGQLASLMMQQGQREEAVALLESIPENDDPNYNNYVKYMMATLYQQLDKKEKAKEIYLDFLTKPEKQTYLSQATRSRQLSMYSPNPSSRNAGTMYHPSGMNIPNNVVRNIDYRKTQALTGLVQMATDDAAMDSLLNELESDARFYADAKSSAEKDAAWETCKLLVLHYLSVDKTEKAADLLQFYREAGFEEMELFNLLIFLSERDEDYDEIAKLLDAVETKFPSKRIEILEAKMNTAILRESFDEAERVLEEISRRSVRPQTVISAIQQMHQAGESERAKRQLESYLKTGVRNSEALALLAKIYGEESEYDKAIELAKEAW
ncbi:MAG: tetratricopeptide repeat protein, partial [Candidatus Omnitrophica bacterium]|nr:tetratricopeptide repeat protein [Candidatus Omnitrophota bacterium]